MFVTAVWVCVGWQGYQTGFMYVSPADLIDAELAPSTAVSSALAGSDRDIARIGYVCSTFVLHNVFVVFGSD